MILLSVKPLGLWLDLWTSPPPDLVLNFACVYVNLVRNTCVRNKQRLVYSREINAKYVFIRYIFKTFSIICIKLRTECSYLKSFYFDKYMQKTNIVSFCKQYYEKMSVFTVITLDKNHSAWIESKQSEFCLGYNSKVEQKKFHRIHCDIK